MKHCDYIWWTPHIIPGQPWCEGEEPYCPLERQKCVLKKGHDGDHVSKTGETKPRINKES